jgi:putative modified peptide
MESEDGTQIQVTMTATPSDAREFLELLAGDDDFRARVEAEPQAVLAEYGIQVTDESFPDTVTLPDKTEIENVLAKIIEADELGKTGHQPHGYAILYCVLGAMPLVDAR